MMIIYLLNHAMKIAIQVLLNSHQLILREKIIEIINNLKIIRKSQKKLKILIY
jgi:hypothetical protein